MEISCKEIQSGGKWVGKLVWVCDYRQPDLQKKAIRHVRPTLVLVRSNDELPQNKRIYYSETHFVKLLASGQPSSTIIGLFDNTGYRSFEGHPVKVFETEAECVQEYNKMADVIIKSYEELLKTIVERLEKGKNEVIENKI